MRKKISYKKAHIEEEGEGNWLVAYADLMTLLWGFFVILSAFSTPDPLKFEKLKKETAESMGGKYENPYNELSDRLKKTVDQLNLHQDIQIEQLTDGIRITAQSATLFSVGSAELSNRPKEILTSVAIAILDYSKTNRVIVEGHTDDIPISNKAFPSNWELSLRRASEVVRLFEKLGVDHKNLRPVGIADVEPLIKVTELSGKELVDARGKNRRIVIRLQKILTSGSPVRKK